MDRCFQAASQSSHDGLRWTHELNSGSNRIGVLEDGCPIILFLKPFGFLNL
jgi:hypothetical protein